MPDSSVIEFVLFILTIIGMFAGVVKYLMDKLDAADNKSIEHRVELERQLRQEFEEAITGLTKQHTILEKHLNNELSSIKETHVRRDDYIRHVDNMEKQFQNMNTVFNDFSRSVTQRLDNIISIVTTTSNKVK